MEESFGEYWNSLQAQDKASAMRFVHPDDLNSFIYRKETPFLSWELEKIDFHSNSSATVTIRLETIITGKKTLVPFQEQWEKTESGWKVRVISTRDAYQRTAEAFRSSSPKLPPEVSLYPPQLRVYKMARPPLGMTYLRNGLESPVTSISLKLDESRFEVAGLPTSVEPGTIEAIRIRFIGEETAENLESSALLRYTQDGKTREIQVPIVYNYADHVTRWLSRQAPQEMKKLDPKPPGAPAPERPSPPPER